MVAENPTERSAASAVDRRSVLRTASGALAATGLANFAGTARASHCPDPDSDDDYWDCDNPSNEFEFYYRPNGDIVEGETSLMVGDKDVVYDNCNDCVYYYFDLVGLHEAFSENTNGGVQDYVETIGFRWSTSSSVTADPQPLDSENVRSGITDPDGDASPYGDEEEAWWALGDVLVGTGSVLYPELGIPAYLYTVARAADLDQNIDDEVRFDPGWGYIDSGGYGYYNMRMQVHESVCGSVTFDGFTEVAGREITTTTKTFELDRHTNCY